MFRFCDFQDKTMNTFGKLAVAALLVLLQVALSVQRPHRGEFRQASPQIF